MEPVVPHVPEPMEVEVPEPSTAPIEEEEPAVEEYQNEEDHDFEVRSESRKRSLQEAEQSESKRRWAKMLEGITKKKKPVVEASKPIP